MHANEGRNESAAAKGKLRITSLMFERTFSEVFPGNKTSEGGLNRVNSTCHM